MKTIATSCHIVVKALHWLVESIKTYRGNVNCSTVDRNVYFVFNIWDLCFSFSCLGEPCIYCCGVWDRDTNMRVSISGSAQSNVMLHVLQSSSWEHSATSYVCILSLWRM